MEQSCGEGLSGADDTGMSPAETYGQTHNSSWLPEHNLLTAFHP
jgi:hypothetical protein